MYKRAKFSAALLSLGLLPVALSASTVTAVDLYYGDGVEYGIGTLGESAILGGLDGAGSTYAGNLLGDSLIFDGMNFEFDAPMVASAGNPIALTQAQDSTLTMLGGAVRGNQPDQTIIVIYTDGTQSTFTQSFSNFNSPQNYNGESIALTMPYRLNGDGSKHPGSYNVYGYTFALDSSKTVQTLLLPPNRNVFFLAANVTASVAPQVTAVNIFDGPRREQGISWFGAPITDGGLDHGGAALSGEVLGTKLTYDGITFMFDRVWVATAGKPIPLVPANDSAIVLLGSAVHGNQQDQTFVVAYADGTSETITQSFSNINTPQSYPGETIAHSMPYRVRADGSAVTSGEALYNVYAYALTLDSTKAVKSLTLPQNDYVFFLAASIRAASAGANGVK